METNIIVIRPSVKEHGVGIKIWNEGDDIRFYPGDGVVAESWKRFATGGVGDEKISCSEVEQQHRHYW